jgi:predicted nucleic acid-binding protein
MTDDAEAGRQFVDSNIVIYAYDRSAGPRHAAASTLMEALWESQRGALSVQVLQEFFVNACRKIPVEEARRHVVLLRSWLTHTPESRDVVEAIDIRRDLKISFWDAMIVRSASVLDCDVLWTEDLNDGQRYRGVRARNPFA